MRDIHEKTVAGLHIVFGLMVLAVPALLLLFLCGAVAWMPPAPAGAIAMLLGFGVPLLAFFAALPAVEVVAAVAFLRGSEAARTVLMCFNVLALFNIPIGTVFGFYALWAMGRDRPRALAPPLPVLSGLAR